MEFKKGCLDHPAVIELLEEHLSEMYATSPPESVHALDLSKLKTPTVSFWSVWDGAQLLGCGAIKWLGESHAELKSMRTRAHFRGRGVAKQLLTHLVDQARQNGYQRISLETGTEPYFAPARGLYQRFGFTTCEPFADYVPDPNSVFMTMEL
ncbi:MAG: putative N-acetyltransferase YsnE [Candidatus Celerinatantimonas neptuna]|nr:MAG: putative N-acetyltransferase YsnE [Candidatus Celerinatantimonas neptuna]